MNHCPLGIDCDSMIKNSPEQGCINYTACGLANSRAWTDYPITFEECLLTGGNYCIIQTVTNNRDSYCKAEEIPYSRKVCGYEPHFLWVNIDKINEGFAKPEKLPYEILGASNTLKVISDVSKSAREAGWHPAISFPPAYIAYSKAKTTNNYEEFCRITVDIFFEFIDDFGNDEEGFSSCDFYDKENSDNGKN